MRFELVKGAFRGVCRKGTVGEVASLYADKLKGVKRPGLVLPMLSSRGSGCQPGSKQRDISLAETFSNKGFVVRFSVLALLLFSLVGGASAETVDNFEDGDLSEWTGIQGNGLSHFDVQSNFVYDGNYALRGGLTADNSRIKYDIPSSQHSKSSFKIRLANERVSQQNNFIELLNENGDLWTWFRIEGGTVNNGQCSNSVNADNNTYYTVKIVPEYGTTNFDFYVDGNLIESDCQAENTINELGKIKVYARASSDGYTYVDLLEVPPYNQAPEFNSSSVSPDPPLIGETADFSYDASDTDGSIQSVELVLKDDGSTVFSGSKSSATGTFSPSVSLTQGDLTAEFTATDNNGATTTKTLTRTLTDTKPVVNVSQPSGTSFDYDQSIRIETKVDDSKPGEELSCTLELDGNQIDERTVTEGDSYTVNTRSDLGSHNVDVTCTEQDDQQSDSGSTSFTVENFKFQSLSGASSGKETTQQSFNAGFKAGDMVNNVSFELQTT